MDGLARDFDAGEQAARIVAGEFVMVAGHEDHPRAIVHLGEDLGHHAALRFVPIPAALELPAIDDVAHQKQGGAFIMGQEIGQRFGLAAARAQMRVGNEDGAVIAAWTERRRRSSPARRARRRAGALEPGAATKRRVQKQIVPSRSPAFVRVRRICVRTWREVADPRESFVAGERRTDESGTGAVLRRVISPDYCVAQMP